MTLPIPTCAFCGLPMTRENRTVVRFRELRGTPTVGWHPGCAKIDGALWKENLLSENPDALAVLAGIFDRAPHGNRRIISRVDGATAYGVHPEVADAMTDMERPASGGAQHP